MTYQYHIQYMTNAGWEGDRISGNCRKRNDAKWLRQLTKPGTRMVVYILDEDAELYDIENLRQI